MEFMLLSAILAITQLVNNEYTLHWSPVLETAINHWISHFSSQNVLIRHSDHWSATQGKKQNTIEILGDEEEPDVTGDDLSGCLPVQAFIS